MAPTAISHNCLRSPLYAYLRQRFLVCDDGPGDEPVSQSHAGEGHPAHVRHMADVDAVHDVVEEVDQLGHHCRRGQLQEQFPNRSRAKLAAAVALTAVFWLFGEKLLWLFGCSEETIVYALPYMRIYASA